MNFMDGNWKSWALVAVLIIGGSFELIKRLPQPRLNSWTKDNFQAPGSEAYAIRNRSVKQVAGAAPSFIPPRSGSAPRAVLPVAPRELKTDEAMKLAKNFQSESDFNAKTNKLKKEDEWEFVVDPKTGKMIKRKKKKKIAKKKEEKKDEAETATKTTKT
jgi:hypothetical protein